MQNPSSYYPAPRSDDPLLREWLRSNRATSSQWANSTSQTLVDDEDLPSPLFEIDDDIAYALKCVWQTASSSSTSSDPFDSRLSISSASASEVVDLPEIPFVSTLPLEDEYEDDDDLGTSFWLRRHPAVSTTSSAERHIAILGHVTDRHHSRERSGSLTSTAPAKSILSCSSSIKTRKGRSAPSVKFLDMPTIHYEDDDEEQSSYMPEPEYTNNRQAPSIRDSARSRKRGWSILDWFLSPQKKTKSHKAAPGHLVISSPLPLCEGRRFSNEGPIGGRYPGSDARSIRSVRSNGSLRSVRSCASRLQEYWAKFREA
ncbi:hypothetical protein BDY19DRAFT_941880 [Irpex rosettiformis]|uniref:Uncharacterized protein n=1 Tax=Irpex rosettiformis TaxID=378272 RepID=A0ACB8U7T3_9APHY|nr:hypothetical protein BDY19DRAFT_941880 [Irpex rosettiformis]